MVLKACGPGRALGKAPAELSADYIKRELLPSRRRPGGVLGVLPRPDPRRPAPTRPAAWRPNAFCRGDSERRGAGECCSCWRCGVCKKVNQNRKTPVSFARLFLRKLISLTVSETKRERRVYFLQGV